MSSVISSYMDATKEFSLDIFAFCLDHPYALAFACAIAFYWFVCYLFLWSLPEAKPKNLNYKFARKISTFPPPFPNGWYVLAFSHECVAGGKPLSVAWNSTEYVLWRTKDGKISLFDAYCPHLGANLAEGVNKGNCLECPFHGWRFDSGGTVVHIPYNTAKPECEKAGGIDLDHRVRIPKSAKIGTHKVIEQDGVVMGWFHAEDEEPTYDIPLINELSGAGFLSFGSRRSWWEMHIQDYAENAADSCHFNEVHGGLNIPIVDWFIKVHHIVVWTEGPLKHEMKFHNYNWLTIFGCKIPFSAEAGPAEVQFKGPGGVTHWRFSTPIGTIILIKGLKPVKPFLCEMIDIWHAPWYMPKIVVNFIIRTATMALYDDKTIWERKSYREKPLLVGNDGPIMKLRRWFKQFYSESSMRIARNLDEDIMDW